MHKLYILLCTAFLTLACAQSQSTQKQATATPSRPLPACEWCGTDEAPDQVSWETTIADANEPGQRLTISGTVYQSDGQSPAEGVILYIYHTNAKGLYEKKGDETGNGRRHGYLRGWVKTNAQGQYRFQTIKPAPYPSRKEEAHIHMTVKEPDKSEYWIDSIVFDDDPLLTSARRDKKENLGGSGIISLNQNGENNWVGVRDIYLSGI